MYVHHVLGIFYAPPNPWIDLIVSPKVKTMKRQIVRVHCLIHNISRVEGCARALGWGLG
jgi:hypothetical protein